jgi:spermidine synthase
LGFHYYGRLFGVLGTALGLVLSVLPGQSALWQRLHATSRQSLVEEDATGVVLLKPLGKGWSLWVSGKRNSDLPYGGLHTVLGALPALMHAAPEAVAIVGLGSGDTAWAAGCRDTTRRISVFEIIRSEFTIFERLRKRPNADERMRVLFEDPRYAMSVADGRNSIESGSTLWDVIEMDALYPTAAGAGSLYSVELFRNFAGKLKPGGLVCTWSPTPRTYASFCRVFRHALSFGNGKVLVGSNDPIAVDPASWKERLRSAPVRAYLGSRPAKVVEGFLDTAELARAPVRPDVNLDLFPRDEFATPR